MLLLFLAAVAASSEAPRVLGACPGFGARGRDARGLVYFAAGENNLHKAFKSVASLRSLGDKTHATLFTDGAGFATLEARGYAFLGLFDCAVCALNASLAVRPRHRADEGCRFANCKRAEIVALRGGKQRAMLVAASTMYDALLFVDADTLFCAAGAVDAAFAPLADGADVAVAPARKSHEEKALVAALGERARLLPEPNTGVLPLRASARTVALLELWTRACVVGRDISPPDFLSRI